MTHKWAYRSLTNSNLPKAINLLQKLAVIENTVIFCSYTCREKRRRDDETNKVSLRSFADFTYKRTDEFEIMAVAETALRSCTPNASHKGVFQG